MLDHVDQIIAYEQGDLGEHATLELFAELIRTGDAWTLQGAYGRQAKFLIDQGYITPDGKLTGKESDL